MSSGGFAAVGGPAGTSGSPGAPGSLPALTEGICARSVMGIIEGKRGKLQRFTKHDPSNENSGCQKAKLPLWGYSGSGWYYFWLSQR